jgi:hypothetical protein
MDSSGEGGGGGKGEGFTGRAAIGYDHGYDGEVFYLGLALDPDYIERFVETYLEKIGEKAPDEENFLRGTWEEGHDRDLSLEILKEGRGPGGMASGILIFKL